MNKVLIIISLLFSPLFWRGAGGEVFAQTNVPPPHIINTAGGSTKIAGGNYYGYNIGEPITGTSGNYYSQGFLQPDYAIGNAFNAKIFFGNESCQGANDGYIIANVYNNKGSVHYVLFPTSDSTSNSVNLSPGTYTLTIRDSINHPLNKVITINASTEVCPVTVHNAFSPNGDGLNDFFIIDGIENYSNNHVYIFNRYGQQLWDKPGYNNTTTVWDGKTKDGTALYAGTYFYIIEIDSKKPMKGWVEITSINK
jgi:gliding motility-associated-like protein